MKLIVFALAIAVADASHHFMTHDSKDQQSRQSDGMDHHHHHSEEEHGRQLVGNYQFVQPTFYNPFFANPVKEDHDHEEKPYTLPLFYNFPWMMPYNFNTYTNQKTEENVHITKREAEPFLPYAHNFPYTTYAHPAVYHAGYPVVMTPKQVADDRFRTTQDYGAKGQYYAESAGTVHIAKREAEPVLAFTHMYNYPHTYYTYPMNVAYSHYYYNYVPTYTYAY